MFWLKRVIARLLGKTTAQEHFKTTAQPMQTAGRAHQERTTRAGSKRSVRDIQLQPQLLPARPPSQKKQNPVKSTTVESKDSSKKQKPVATAKSRTSAGSSTQTAARKIRQHVK
jgi:hypothetical protein